MVRINGRRLLTGVSLAALPLVASGCVKSEKSENPLSPHIAGPMPGVEITAPILMEPGRGWKLTASEQPVQLLVENAATNGPRPLLYRFEVAADSGFQTIVFAREGIAQGEGGQNGRTALRLPDRLEEGRTYYWRARAYDGANTGPFASAVNFDIQLPPKLFTPQLLEPINGQTAATPRPLFRVRNADRQGPIRNVNYGFQVATDQGFGNVVAQGSTPENTITGETLWMPSVDLAPQITHYWRAMASDGVVSSPWQVSFFRTPNRPGPGPGPNPGGPCSGAPIDIVTCRRAQYGALLSPAEANPLLRSIASDLNRGSSPYYGILIKTSGNNCGGYACDIICASDGNVWDVFMDGPDSSHNYSGTAYPVWEFKGVEPDRSRCTVIP